MNILILGDSWGVPNYLQNHAKENGRMTPEGHVEFLLRNLGYNVYNFSLNGNSNIRTMEAVGYANRSSSTSYTLVPHPYLPEWMNPVGHPSSIPEHIDWILWFHTEVFRDGFNPKKTFHENLVEKSHEVYSYAKSFFNTMPGKLAVIGGQAAIGPSVKDIFYQYIQPDFIIEDWRSDIIGEMLPECYTVSSINGSRSWALQGTDDVEEKERLVDIQETVIVAMQKSLDFADDAHPSDVPHEKLARQLHEVFQKLP